MKDYLFLRAVAALLTAAALVLTASCGEKPATPSAGNDGDAVTVTEAVTEAAPATDEWGRDLVETSLPADLRYDGRDFNMLIRETREWEFTAEELNGDILNDANYLRNLAVEERMGIRLHYILASVNDQMTIYKASIMAGDNAYDCGTIKCYDTAMNMTAGYFLNLHEFPYVDAGKPWWSSSFIDEMTVNDHLYALVGSMHVQAMSGSYCMYADLDMLRDYRSEVDMYDLVYSGGWTIDALRGIVTGFYSDLNGDNAHDKGDLYGYGSSVSSFVDAYTYTCADPVTVKDADGRPVLNFGGERTVDTVNKVYDLLFATDGAIGGEYTAESHQQMIAKFKNNELCFFHCLMEFAEQLRDFDDEYGIFPIPKLREEDEYITTAQDGISITSVPVTCPDPEFVGAVLEAMSEQSWRDLVPAYFEVVMKDKYLRSNEAARMYDLIRESLSFNFGFVVTGVTGIAGSIRTLLNKRSNDFASMWAANRTTAETKLNAFIDGFYAE